MELLIGVFSLDGVKLGFGEGSKYKYSNFIFTETQNHNTCHHLNVSIGNCWVSTHRINTFPFKKMPMILQEEFTLLMGD